MVIMRFGLMPWARNSGGFGIASGAELAPANTTTAPAPAIKAALRTTERTGFMRCIPMEVEKIGICGKSASVPATGVRALEHDFRRGTAALATGIDAVESARG